MENDSKHNLSPEHIAFGSLCEKKAHLNPPNKATDTFIPVITKQNKLFIRVELHFLRESLIIKADRHLALT